ncbi:MAG: NADH-quinone oxidoreductase subunit NuoK [Planctomycetes bacterium]|nr:NADH-quinone oxidoreductase subunit NuoK [Planctomycetota bacterium]
MVALLLFSMGLYAVLARRNLIAILIGVELMLNAANVNFLAFAYFRPSEPAVAKIITLFVIGLAAAEAAIALAIVLMLHRQIGSVDVEDIAELKGAAHES